MNFVIEDAMHIRETIAAVVRHLHRKLFVHPPREQWKVIMENGREKGFRSHEAAHRFAWHRAIYWENGPYCMDTDREKNIITLTHRQGDTALVDGISYGRA